MILPKVPPSYNPAAEQERNRRIDAGFRQAHKRGQDVEIGNGRLILTGEDNQRYEVYITGAGALAIRAV